MQRDFDVYLQSFFNTLTLQCCVCGAKIGTVPRGEFLMLAQHRISGQMFVGVAPPIDWYACKRHGSVSTPLIISLEMVSAHNELLRQWLHMHDVTLQKFREEFPITPYVSALIAERITLSV